MSATIIDSLVTEIGIDASKFVKGQKDALDQLKKTKEEAKKQAVDIEGSTVKSLQSVEKVATAAFSLFAAFTAGRSIKDFAVAMTTINAGLGRTSYTLDTNVKELGKWRNAVRLVGGDADQFTNSVAGIVGQFQQFSITGEAGGAIPYFRALGIEMSDTEGRMRPFSDWILDVADKLSAMDPARAAAWGRSLGLDPGTVNLAIHGRQKLVEYLEAVKNYGPTEEDAKAAERLQIAYMKWDAASSRLGMTLLARFSPAIEGVSNLLRNLSDWVEKNPTVLYLIADGLLAIGTAITVGLSVSALSAALNGLKMILGVGAAAGVAGAAGGALGAGGAAVGGAAAGALVRKMLLRRALAAIAIMDVFQPGADYKPNDANWRAQQMQGREGGSTPKGPLWHFFHDLLNGNSGGTSGIPDEGQALLGALASKESAGRYDALYGGGSFSDFSQFPQWSGKMGPAGMSHAAGAYQFQPGTWKDAQKALGLRDFSPESQDKAAWWLAQRDYASRRPGHDLLADLRSGNPATLADIGAALHPTWAASNQGLLGSSSGLPPSASGALGAPTAALAGSAMTNNRAYDMSRETHIGTINVDAGHAKDSAGVWQSIGGATENLDMTTQANTGPQ